MRIAVVVAAMLFCMAGCSRKEIQKSVAVEPRESVAVEPRESVADSIGMELIEIPAGGWFRMGDNAGVPVTLTKPFELGKYEVTQGQWKSVMGTEPWDGQKYVKADKDCPATYVSWDDATDFCKKLNQGGLTDKAYRLPTEAEWEYACRAGTETAFSFGDDYSKLGEYGWFDGNTSKVNEPYAHKVGLKKPNLWGLHDMHGNVWEFCSDWYGGLSGGIDPVGPGGELPRTPVSQIETLSVGIDQFGPGGGSGRVDRGGSWGDDPGFCRSADRISYDPSSRNNGLGFRVARSQLAQ